MQTYITWLNVVRCRTKPSDTNYLGLQLMSIMFFQWIMDSPPPPQFQWHS